MNSYKDVSHKQTRRKLEFASLAVVLFALFVVSVPGALFARSALEIIQKNDALPSPSSSELSMALVIERGGAREIKEFTLRMKKVSSETRTRISFQKPTRIEFLSHSAAGIDTAQWIKLSSPVVRRIASGEKNSSFVNSHFYYADLETPEIADFKYSHLTEAKCGSDDCYKIRSEKKRGEKVYSHTDLYIRKSDYVLVQVDFYENERHTKTLLNEKIEWIQGIPTPRKTVMSRADGSGRSILYTRSIHHNTPLATSLFNPDAL